MSKNKIDWRSEDVWKLRLDALKEKALKEWMPLDRPKGGPFTPVLIHDWKISLSVGGSGVQGEDVWVFSARWPGEGKAPADQVAWIAEAITHLGAPAGTKEADMGGASLGRYWIWRAPGRLA